MQQPCPVCGVDFPRSALTEHLGEGHTELELETALTIQEEWARVQIEKMLRDD